MTALHTLELPGQLDLAAIQATRPDRYPGLLRTTGIDSGWDILFGFPQQIDRVTLADGLESRVVRPLRSTKIASEAKKEDRET